MTEPQKNIAASIQARLKHEAEQQGKPFAELLQYYAMERFLYRLSKSQYADKFVLKGGLLIYSWNIPLRRPTRDIDFRGSLVLQRDFILQRDFDSYYEILRFTLMSEPLSREEIAMSPRRKCTTRRALRRPPASGRKPTDRIRARDVSRTADELQVFHRQFQPLFQRREQRAWSLLYLCGQLSNLERKTIEPMVLSLLGADPNAIRGMQQFIGQGEWDSAPLLRHAQGLVSSWLGEEDGVVIVDGSGFSKQGRHSVGVARQYCGALGKIANCQEGVFLVAKRASRRGYAFVDERLYVPEEWFSAESRERWQACGIPENLAFRTEPELGLEMITALVEHSVLPFRWVTCDEKYGKIPAFLDGIAALDKWYLAIRACGCGPQPLNHLGAVCWDDRALILVSNALHPDRGNCAF